MSGARLTGFTGHPKGEEKSGLAVGIDKGTRVTKRELGKKPSYRKGVRCAPPCPPRRLLGRALRPALAPGGGGDRRGVEGGPGEMLAHHTAAGPPSPSCSPRIRATPPRVTRAASAVARRS